MQHKCCAKLLTKVRLYATLVFGHFSWKPPYWLTTFYQRVVSCSRLTWAILLSAIILFGMGFYWYKALPRPIYVTVNITVPEITPIAEKLVPDNLTIDFIGQAVAPLQALHKKVTTGIVLTPTFPGTWVWQSDHRLQFFPAQDWPAGQKYNIDFNKHIFSSTVHLAKLHYSFITRPFVATITEFKFYQNPIDAQLRQVVAALDFNYPVDPQSLENHIKLQLQALKKGQQDFQAETFHYTISYGAYKRTAYIHSAPLPLPATERYIELTINKGLRPLAGPSITPAPLKKNVLLPDPRNFFKINAISANIIRNVHDTPEQVLTLETTLGTTQAALNDHVHVVLLPQDCPATATTPIIKNYHWQSPGEVNPTALALAKPVDLQAVPSEGEYTTLHRYKMDLPVGHILVKIDRGTLGWGNYPLAHDYKIVLPVPAYPQEIGFLHPGSVLALDGEKKLSVTARGLSAVKFTLARVLPDDIHQLVTQTAGNFNGPYFLNYHFNEQNISEIFTEIHTFNNEKLAQLQYTALSLKKYLLTKKNPAGPNGLFLLNAQGWDPQKNVPLNVTTKRLILITDCGVLTKDNKNGSHDVFVQSITHGTPISQAKITILGKNGLPIITRTTGPQGHAFFPALNDFIDEREPTVYLITHHNDIAFMPFKSADRQLNYSRFDVGGAVSNDLDQTTLSAYVFSDRGIYRPGDTAHIGLIVKQAYAAPQPAGLPLEIIVTGPQGTTLQTKKIVLGPDGFFTFDFNTQASFSTGQYKINLFIVKDNRPGSLLGSTSVQVAEFLPDRMRTSIHLSKQITQGWTTPAGLTAQVNLTNLYGAPAAKRKVRARLLLTPQTIQFAQYPHYTFMEPLVNASFKQHSSPAKVFSETLTDTETNDQGNAEFSLHLERFAQATYQLTVFVEGFEAEGGRSVATQVSALISPLAYLIGYKPDGDLKFIKQHQPRQVHFIAINPQLKQQAQGPLKVVLFAERPVTALVKKPDGTYQYQSFIQLSRQGEKPFTISAQGEHYSLATDKVGDFVVAVEDAHQTELCRFRYSVVGSDQQALPMDTELTVKLNRPAYKPGQDIQLAITAPYIGSGYMTIERDNVYAYQWFQTKTAHSLQKIRVPKNFLGGGYVNVTFVRDWNSPDIFRGPLSYSIVPFAIEHDDKNLRVQLEAPALVAPGAPLVIHYKSDKPGKIIIFAVDEGILRVANYKTPGPLEFFFQKRALEVNAQQTMDQILPKFMADRELSAVGGDNGSEEKLNKYLNPFKRKTDLPVVYWSGLLNTDDHRREVSYNVPDYFNGTLHIMAVAVAENALGSAERTTQSRGNFVINPNAPTFVAPDDQFEVTASIANNIKNSGAAPVTIQLLTTPQLEIIGPATQTLIINEQQEKTIKVKLHAKAQLGTAAATFVASSQDKSSQTTVHLSIRPASMYRTTLISGQSNAPSQSISLTRGLYTEKRQVEAAISTSPLIFVFGLNRYLDNYPYGCTEQLVSQAFPLMAMIDRPWFVRDTKKLTERVQATAQALLLRQMANGAFSYWPALGDNKNNAFSSTYAMHFLTEARLHGFVVPTDSFNNGINYLKELATEGATDLNQARIQAYAIYILTRNEMVTTNYLTHLQLYLDQDKTSLWHNDITAVYMAATYQLLKNPDEANRLLKIYQAHTKKINFTTDFYNQPIVDAEYLYLLAQHFPAYLAKFGGPLVSSLVHTLNGDEINTLLSSYASLALSSYDMAVLAPTGPAFGIDEIFKNGQQKNTFTTTDNRYQQAFIGPLAYAVQFSNPAKRPYFYQITETGFDKTATAPIKQHLEIDREYRNPRGQVLSTVPLGDEVEVHLQLRGLDGISLNNIAIVDLLPGGFEVVANSINPTNIEHADVREDRVVFFASIGPNTTEIVYRIKATNRGHYRVPPIFATSMYGPSIQAQGACGQINVE